MASGAGISLLPLSAAKNNRAAVASCKIVDNIPVSEIALAWHKKRAHAVVEEFKKFVLANTRINSTAAIRVRRRVGLAREFTIGVERA